MSVFRTEVKNKGTELDRREWIKASVARQHDGVARQLGSARPRPSQRWRRRLCWEAAAASDRPSTSDVISLCLTCCHAPTSRACFRKARLPSSIASRFSSRSWRALCGLFRVTLHHIVCLCRENSGERNSTSRRTPTL